MGRRNRERIERIRAGLEKSISEKNRGQVVGTSVGVLQHQSTDKQVGFLSQSLAGGKLASGKLRETLEKQARVEMRKGVEKFVKRGVTPTVDLLLVEYRKERQFQQLAASVGLDEAWFVQLAEDEMRRVMDART